MSAHVSNRRDAGETVIYRANKKAGVRESHCGRQTNSVEGRKTCLVRTVIEPTHGVGLIEILITIHHHFSADLVSMIVPHPCETRIGCRLAIYQMDLVSRTSGVPQTSLTLKQS